MSRGKWCRHRRTYRLWRWYGRWLRWHSAVDLKIPWEAFDARRCTDCSEFLPLGPATDTPETAVEVRAIELALDERNHEALRLAGKWSGVFTESWLLASVIATHGENE